MIIGISGAVCSGKQEFAKYLASKYGFKIVNLLVIFKEILREKKIKIPKRSSPFRLRRTSEDRKKEED